MKQAEDRLRLLIFDPTDARHLERPDRADRLAAGRHGGARRRRRGHQRARATAPTSLRARKDIENAQTNVKLRGQSAAARRPAERQLSGERTRRHRRCCAPAASPARSSARATSPPSDRSSISCSRSDYPTWAVGVSVSYPIGAEHRRGELRAGAARSGRRRKQRLKSAEARAIQQVRDAAWKIEMNAKRIETTRAARELAEQRLDAERKRFEVGMSTSFLVIQAQRDLAQATNERARRGARLRPVAGRLRGAAGGGPGRSRRPRRRPGRRAAGGPAGVGADRCRRRGRARRGRRRHVDLPGVPQQQ